MDTLTTKTIPVGDLALYHRNPRRGNIPAILESLRVLGQYKPIVVNAGTHTGRPLEVLAGNHTLMAARDLGWETIDAVTVDVDDDQAARIVLVDNRSSDLAHNDDEVIVAILQDLPDLAATGYTDDDLAALTNAGELPSDDDWKAGFDNVPDGQQNTHYRSFTLTTDQAAVIDKALDAAAEHVDSDHGRGAAALTLLAEAYIAGPAS